MSNFFDEPPAKLKAITINGAIHVESEEDAQRREDRRKQRKSRWDKSRTLSKRPWICPRLWPASQTWTKIPNLFVTDSKPKRSWNARRPWWSQPWIQARWMKNRRKYICYILKSRTNHDFSHGQIWVRKCFRNLLLNIVNVFLLRTLFPSKLTVKTF